MLKRSASSGAADRSICQAQAFEGLGRGDFVEELEVDVEDGGLALRLDDYVLLPDFFE
jgi:hypothetical protein